MVFSSIVFLLYFLPTFLLLYHIVNRKFKNYVLLLASLLFYYWGAPSFFFVILLVTIIDFYLIKRISRTINLSQRKIILFFSLTMNLALLLYFKYSNFFIENLNETFAFAGYNKLSWTSVILPIGISFYTFQSITYSIDVYRDVHRPLNRLSDYLIYIFCFPQMIAGPIVRFHTIASEIIYRVENIDDKLSGFYRFSIGLAKKVLIANILGQQADFIFQKDLTLLNSGEAWIAIIAYSFQIYYDFSGYSDMAIGLGKMIGLNFPENFNSPYISKSITEFWKRWHITLGKFMRDYLYIPIGGNKLGSRRTYLNLFIVFILSGLWHGASWNFILWGLYHGFFIISDRLFLDKILKDVNVILRITLTFLTVTLGWVLFRLDTLTDIRAYFYSLFDYHSFMAPHVNTEFCIILFIASLFSFLSYFEVGKKLQFIVFYNKSYTFLEHSIFSIISLSLLILSVSSITTSGFNPFIYFKF